MAHAVPTDPLDPSTPNSVTNAPPPSFKKIDLELLHQRLGHQSLQSLLAASHDTLWADVLAQFGPDTFCIGCKIGTSRSANRTFRPVSDPQYPGQILFLDIIYNPSKTSITTSTYFPYYLLVVCALSRYGVLVGTQGHASADITDALEYWATNHRPHPSYVLNDVSSIHTDAGTHFISTDFCG
jgi:hypothetical protein